MLPEMCTVGQRYNPEVLLACLGSRRTATVIGTPSFATGRR
ncbi:hypothetical protein MEBOL_002221 [Melittangium boletus DSM 14713]|uniref:Uncharacterized protein n=1 Tax=Melittangium boletus DSM 14713 TaxID=1294270 RepID=A0A250IC71_9BACT|nr:hypothetical protein MEBOL_002221 [Melittangium boletus DSM 14713]